MTREKRTFPGTDGSSAEFAGATSYQSSNDIIFLIKVSQGVSGIGANVQSDITFLRSYMKRLFRRMMEEGYAVLGDVDVHEAHLRLIPSSNVHENFYNNLYRRKMKESYETV